MKKELEGMGYEPVLTRKGAVLCDLGGKDTEHGLSACQPSGYTWCDGSAELKSNGRLKLTNVGGLNPNNTEAEKLQGLYT